VAPSAATGAGGCAWPVRGVVTSEYGSRWGRLHAGIDIAAPTGTPIHAARAGTVLIADAQGGYGLAVVIDHGTMTTLYGHQSRIAVRVGDEVGQGEVVGYVGSTGHSTGPHLHFETRYGGSPVNPRPCLP
jgi:murein DD-endopeptidase MepM/ murein hydrolase activator NlpD